ncbi:MAG: hypothetical protein NT154_22850 [Verrucomicrobia bacterium]|nr:hypothetical protein [Verrucomicrobiota bacterium]
MRRDSSPNQAAPMRGGILLCSAGLNVLLLAAVLALARHEVSQPLPPSARQVAGPQRATAQEAAPIDSDAVVTNQMAFRWAQLESQDFRIYIANLRAAHCPERIICDLVFHGL